MINMKCAKCEDKKCKEHGSECTPKREEYIDRYKTGNRKLVESSYEVTSDTKAKANRVQELILFSKKMNYKRLGIAFCKGLSKEAKVLNDILEKEGFDVVSVCCKIDDIDKSEIDVKKINDTNSPEVSCNPYAQADVLNNANVDLTVTVGFCMGHDILFYKNIKTPVTPLIVKDRVYGHKTIEALKQ